MRLDLYLYQNFCLQSRNKASELIKNNLVSINGKIINKPSFFVNEKDNVNVLEENFFVSRSAKKLYLFLLEHPIQNLMFEGKCALDIGSSTGGFTQVLLKYNVNKVFCIDVGSNQLHTSLRNNSRISIHENTDIRDFQAKPFDIITCDVSFISILQILPSIDKLAIEDIIILYKPQYEVGLGVKRNSSGVVLDKKAILKAQKEFETTTFSMGWNIIHKDEAKVLGKEGNQEFIYHFKKDIK